MVVTKNCGAIGMFKSAYFDVFWPVSSDLAQHDHIGHLISSDLIDPSNQAQHWRLRMCGSAVLDA
jgi:hypothetical protein